MVRYGEVVLYCSTPESPNKHGGIEWFKRTRRICTTKEKKLVKGRRREKRCFAQGERTGPPIDPCRSGFSSAQAFIHAERANESEHRANELDEDN